MKKNEKKAIQTVNTAKIVKLKNLKVLSKNELEKIIAGTDPPISRGTKTDTQD